MLIQALGFYTFFSLKSPEIAATSVLFSASLFYFLVKVFHKRYIYYFNNYGVTLLRVYTLVNIANALVFISIVYFLNNLL